LSEAAQVAFWGGDGIQRSALLGRDNTSALKKAAAWQKLLRRLMLAPLASQRGRKIVRIISVSLALLCIVTAYAQPPASHPPASAATAAADSGEKPSAFVVKFKVKPGMNAAFEKAFAEMQKGVAAAEPGNLYYDLYRIDQDPQTYVILEHYKDQDAVSAHGKSEHAKKLIATLKDLLDGPPDAMRLILVSSKQHPKP
jgi:quinol monooxygenase YgiN